MLIVLLYTKFNNDCNFDTSESNCITKKMFNLINKIIYDKVLSFESEFVILDSNENTVTFHLSSIYLQMSLTENTSKNYGWAKSDALFNQRLDRNQLAKGNNWTTSNTND